MFMKSAADFTNRFFVLFPLFFEWREVREFVHGNSGIRLRFVKKRAYKVFLFLKFLVLKCSNFVQLLNIFVSIKTKMVF